MNMSYQECKKAAHRALTEEHRRFHIPDSLEDFLAAKEEPVALDIYRAQVAEERAKARHFNCLGSAWPQL